MPSTTPYSIGLIDVPLGRMRPERVPSVHPSVPAVRPGTRIRSTKSSPVTYCARPSRATSPAANASLRRTVDEAVAVADAVAGEQHDPGEADQPQQARVGGADLVAGQRAGHGVGVDHQHHHEQAEHRRPHGTDAPVGGLRAADGVPGPVEEDADAEQGGGAARAPQRADDHGGGDEPQQADVGGHERRGVDPAAAGDAGALLDRERHDASPRSSRRRRRLTSRAVTSAGAAAVRVGVGRGAGSSACTGCSDTRRRMPGGRPRRPGPPGRGRGGRSSHPSTRAISSRPIPPSAAIVISDDLIIAFLVAAGDLVAGEHHRRHALGRRAGRARTAASPAPPGRGRSARTAPRWPRRASAASTVNRMIGALLV